MKKEYINLRIIGSDETGVGDYMTPLVAAAAFVPIHNIKKLMDLGITDSKKITDEKILILFEKIKPLIKSSVRHLTQSGYNKLNTSFNAHELKTLIHLNAIEAVESRIEGGVDLIIIDQYVNRTSFDKYITKINSSTIEMGKPTAKIKLVEKGEMEHIAVAAASVVARAYLLNMMKAQEKKWGMKFALGTNDTVVSIAKEFVAKHGKENLNQVAKLSFKTTEKII